MGTEMAGFITVSRAGDGVGKIILQSLWLKILQHRRAGRCRLPFRLELSRVAHANLQIPSKWLSKMFSGQKIGLP